METPRGHNAVAATGKRLALLIACDDYADPGLGPLRGPARDVEGLSEVLADPAIGDFAVTVLANRLAHEVRVAVSRLFGTAGRNDLVLLHLSGHGVKDAAGRLHFAAADTMLDLLSATGISADFVRDEVDRSPARQVMLWLDCCFSGAFPAGLIPKAGGRIDVAGQLSASTGRGCLVMTASNHVEHAFEIGSGPAPGERAVPSFFTEAIIEGLRSGDADLDADGEIEAGELYTYVHERVRSRTEHQTPSRNDRASGPIFVAHSRKSPPLPPGLDPELRAALRSKHAAIRRGAFRTLSLAADNGDRVAIETLRALDDLRPPPAPAFDVTPEPPTRRRGVLLSAGVAAVVVAVLAIVLVKLLSGTDDTRGGGTTSPAPSTSAPPATTPSPSTSSPVSQATDGVAAHWVTVRVFNNSVVKELGARAANDIRGKGWNVTEVSNYSLGIIPTSTAFYRPGTDEEAAAKDLAAELRIKAEPRFEGIANASPGVLVIVTKDYGHS
jgi:hypothetical protein